MGITEKIKDIELEIARTQKNKATEHHLGLLKAKLAKYRTQLLEPSGKKVETSKKPILFREEEKDLMLTNLEMHGLQ